MALVLPFCNTAAMNLHLAEISGMVTPGKHAVLLLDAEYERQRCLLSLLLLVW